MGIVLFIMFWTVLYGLHSLSGFALGQTYDYQTRRKTYYGTKVIVSALIVWGLWLILPFL